MAAMCCPAAALRDATSSPSATNVTSAPRTKLSLPKPNRVLRSSEFRQIYQAGVRMSSRYFAAFCLRSAVTEPPFASTPARFGFTVPRAVGNAVVRNRLKRRMREAVRSHMVSLPARCAIVFNPRRTVLDAPFEELCQEIGRILSQCKQL